MTKAKYLREWRRKNPGKMKAYRDKWTSENPEYQRPALTVLQKLRQVELQRSNPNRKASWTKHNRATSEQRALYYKNNAERIKARISVASKTKEGRLKRNVALQTRKQSDPQFKLLHTLRTRIGRAVQNSGARKSEKTVELIGCAVEFLKGWIQSKFKPGMTWENHGQHGWHIDHILPCSMFDLSDPEQQRKCFHYTNLQPLWWLDNLIKADKIPS